MFTAHSFINELQKKYPAPPNNKIHFDMNDIQSFEKAFGAELPSDLYDFLQTYGYGSFDDYFYIWNPFISNGIKAFREANDQAKANYESLENEWDLPMCVDCYFSDNELIILNGDKKFAESLRIEKIDKYTRSKIIALGNHYPYEFFPKKEGLIYFGRTDDDDFFVRIHNKKTSIVMYSDGYYEFDMGITEFIYGYLTKTIKLPLMNDDTEWTFIDYA